MGTLYQEVLDTDTPASRARLAWATAARLMFPQFGCCSRCGAPWNVVEGHTTQVGAGGGCFPLCEHCWAPLTPEERLPYYKALMAKWRVSATGTKYEGESPEPGYEERLFLAVMTGG